MEKPAYLPDNDYQQLVHLLKKIFKGKPARVLVFGSRATGNHREDSDLDLVVCSKKDIGEKIKEIQKAIKNSSIETPIEILDYSEVQLATLQRIQQEGRIFWENEKNAVS